MTSDRLDPFVPPRVPPGSTEGVGRPLPRALAVGMTFWGAATVAAAASAVVRGGYEQLLLPAFMVVVLVGFIARIPFAWATMRAVSTFLALAMLVGAGLSGAHAVSSAGPLSAYAPPIIFAMCAVGLGVPAVLSGLNSSRAYFGLVCPICTSFNVRAASITYRRKRCRSCKWFW